MNYFEKHRGILLLNFSATFIFLSLAAIRSVGDVPLETNTTHSLFLFGSATFTDLMIAVSQVLSPFVLLVLTILFSVVLFVLHKKRWALFFLATMLCATLSSVLFKSLFQIARPVDAMIPEIGWGFPSGHATAVSVFFFSLYYAIEEKIHDSTVVFLWGLVSVGLVFMTGFSRVYLGVHFVTDVLAGLALGIFWVTAGILVFERTKRND